jgi:hypothetical protein
LRLAGSTWSGRETPTRIALSRITGFKVRKVREELGEYDA